ncbi:MAG: SUMF1/EgtB/PvdO family nonheme iron enzyme [Nitrospirae bacterium]|nr:SUMF1/EgtB/PvdO family nonheme iron enzyme [Nitrospirota bacterium]
MQRDISDSDRVLLICSEPYVKKADEGSGGVGYERLIVTAEVAENIDTMKFIPVIRNNSSRKVPRFLGSRRYVDFSNEEEYGTKLQELIRGICGLPAQVKPPLGKSSLSDTDPVMGIELVLVKGGCYRMGDVFGDGFDDEKPVREVCVDDFYLWKYEVTVGEFRAFVNEAVYMCIPLISATYSSPFRPLVPLHSSHLFRSIPATLK